jgi:hypothetical protein
MNGAVGLPVGPSELTAAWIGAGLVRAAVLDDASGMGLSVEEIEEGRGFVGRSVRCRLSYASPRQGAPASLIAKFPAADERRRKVFAEAALYEREVRFYREIAAQCGVPVPRCYFAEMGPDGRFVILLEDLAPAKPGDPLAGCTVNQAREALEVAARMHARWWDDEWLNSLDWLPAADPPRILQSVRTMYSPAWDSFVARAGKHVSPYVRRTGDQLRRSLPLLLNRLSELPRTLVHGDFQLGNVFFGADGRVAAVTDWQVIINARAPMDVAHFLVRSLQVEDRRHFERELVRVYQGALAARGVTGYSFEQCWNDYRLAALSQLGLGVLLSHGLETATDGPGGEARDALAAVVGARLMAAVEDLRPLEALEERRGWSIPFLNRGG